MPALTLAVLVMRRSALSMRLVTVVLVFVAGVGSGVVLVSAAALVMLPLPVETCGQGQGCRRPAGQLPRVTVRAALLVCSVPTLLVALTRVRTDQASVRGDVGGCARPGVAEGDDVAEGLAHGAGADAGGLGDAQVGAVDAAGHRGAGVCCRGSGQGWCWSAPPRW